jgi:hypothetical protein
MGPPLVFVVSSEPIREGAHSLARKVDRARQPLSDFLQSLLPVWEKPGRLLEPIEEVQSVTPRLKAWVTPV